MRSLQPRWPMIAAGDNFGWMSLWEAESGKNLGVVQAHPAEVSSIAFSPDGKSLVTGGFDSDDRQKNSTIRIWDVANDHLGAARSFEANSRSTRASAGPSEAPRADITAHGIPVSAVTPLRRFCPVLCGLPPGRANHSVERHERGQRMGYHWRLEIYDVFVPFVS